MYLYANGKSQRFSFFYINAESAYVIQNPVYIIIILILKLEIIIYLKHKYLMIYFIVQCDQSLLSEINLKKNHQIGYKLSL